MAVALAQGAAGQVEWQLEHAPMPRLSSAMVFDGTAGRCVLFSGPSNLADTWLWDGSDWAAAPPGAAPPWRYWHAMAFDSLRARTVLFGGDGGLAGVDTWEWDGANWLQRITTTQPPSRRTHSMAYDSARGRVVMFGGADSSNYLGDTWEWDGTSWLLRQPTTSPGPRMHVNMCFDSLRGVAVLFGGYNGQAFLADTWEWNGTNWTQRTPATSPSGRIAPMMAFDAARGRTVLFGGYDVGGMSNQTWEWDGANWTLIPSMSTTPIPRYGAAFGYDSVRQACVLFGGGQSISTPMGDTWLYDAAGWRQARSPRPTERTGHAMAFDAARGETVLFGGAGLVGGPLRGLDETWTSRPTWQLRAPVNHPSRRASHAMAFDAGTDRTVLFGGAEYYAISPNGPLWRWVDDTWEWDGANWTLRSPAMRPPARSGHSLAHDAANARIVLFGGQGLGGVRQDTWTWDGVNWQQALPPVSPPARAGAAMAYHRTRQRIVLFGGVSGASQVLGDTWEWNGTAWTRMATGGPSARTGAALAYDAARRRCVLTGGNPPDTWEWDGAWLQRAPLGGPIDSVRLPLVFDEVQRLCLSFDGLNLGSYGPVYPATYTGFGSGCAGPAAAPVVTAGVDSLPWLGDLFVIHTQGLAINQPAFLIFGLSRTMWGPVSLPLDLAALGMPGCQLAVSIDSVRVLAPVAGVASTTFAIPATVGLIGFEFHNQAIAVDPGANPAGLLASHAATARVGSR